MTAAPSYALVLSRRCRTPQAARLRRRLPPCGCHRATPGAVSSPRALSSCSDESPVAAPYCSPSDAQLHLASLLRRRVAGAATAPSPDAEVEALLRRHFPEFTDARGPGAGDGPEIAPTPLDGPAPAAVASLVFSGTGTESAPLLPRAPPDLRAAFPDLTHRAYLDALQLSLENSTLEDAAGRFEELRRGARDRGDWTSVPPLKRLMTGWYGPLRHAIALESDVLRGHAKRGRGAGANGRDYKGYGEVLLTYDDPG
eukprot:CAMPEP_0194294572 /NCGR_PEP_ID=MMETSP0169-20130528/51040_1 /TAXON_ID=218684 /ORGANISM="Corethron pennatum, Strain L29A3" /LENGTH=255 /DNA_ID=CAMNT_0039043473 /DNA_START=25 /DNA_END=789 /DNA_ORIENTATION=+